jgi:predicted DNA-binding antitoxin AbrB/MazE fold protein
MFAVKAIYDGSVAKPQEAVPFKENYDVVITFLELSQKQTKEVKEISVDLEKQKRIQEKRAILESLVGICADIPLSLDEIRAERLARH